MTTEIPRDRPLYRKLLDLNAPEDYLELMRSLVKTPQQEERILMWLEISGERDLETIMDRLYEVID